MDENMNHLVQVYLTKSKTTLQYAGMLEQAYKSDLKSDARKRLRVRVSLPAPVIYCYLESNKICNLTHD